MSTPIVARYQQAQLLTEASNTNHIAISDAFFPFWVEAEPRLFIRGVK